MSHVLPTFGYQPYPDRIAVDENSDYPKTIQENKNIPKICGMQVSMIQFVSELLTLPEYYYPQLPILCPLC